VRFTDTEPIGNTNTYTDSYSDGNSYSYSSSDTTPDTDWNA
jgi:hypothetical protein